MTRTTCPYCGVGCGVTVVDGIPRGDEVHPANFGRLCSKGAALKDTLALPERLTTPMLHGKPAGWDETLDHIAAEFLRIRAEHGPDAIAFYVSGQFLTEDYYVANKLMKGFIGSANIDTNSRLCMASSVAGHMRAFGEYVVPGCYDDLEEADLVIQVGSNMAWCHPVLYQRMMAAREKRGTKVINIDPRRTATAESADLHLALAPGSDVVLWCGLLAYLDNEGVLDREWTARHVSGLEETLDAAHAAAPSIGFVAAAAQINPGDVRAFYDMFARTERVVTLYSQGVNQSVTGTDKVNAILNCHLATACIGRPGMGPFSLTGQPNAMGGREVGGLANQLAAHMAFTREDIDRVRRFWKAPAIADKPGLKAVDMFEAIHDGRIKAVWIAATNPADSMPRASRIREALEKCPLVIVADAWPTDTTRLADVVLPAAGWAEKDGTVTNSERCISRQRAFRAAPGIARPDWWMFTEVARRMGWDDAFPYQAPAEIFCEHAALSAFENHGARLFDLGGLCDLEDGGYEAMAPVQWPVPRHGRGVRGPRLFARGGFSTPDRKARMIPLRLRAEEGSEKFPLTLNTGRVRDQWHTMTRTGRVANLMSHISSPSLALHPRDAAARGITDRGLIRIASADASVVMRASVDEGVRPGDVFAPMHWTDQFSSSGPIDKLVHALADPHSGQPDLKGTKVSVTAIAECWRGSLFRLDNGDPGLSEAVWWSMAQTRTGFAFELSGWNPLEKEVQSEQVLRRLLKISGEAELVSYSDPRRAIFRYAGILRGRLVGCVFFAPPLQDFAGIEQAKALLGKEISAMERISLLAGLESSGAQAASRIVCACFSVSETAITGAIAEQGCQSPAEIGKVLKAGTNCGSCIPEIKKLLGTTAPAPAA
ncbi:MAG: molybdopterin-dependent oxidoreductase [Alphaproteobacteria bacterium]|nr:molybdopterin-dependent oxidoreductase [Alphaproteobacteria bacterium]